MKAADSLEHFVLHALVLETETLARLEEVAEMMAVHGNRPLWRLFTELAEESQDHVNDLRQRGAGLELPELKPWEYEWPDPEPPEVLDIAELHYLLTPAAALALVLEREVQAEDYYRAIAAAAADEQVRALAESYAHEEAGHVARIRARQTGAADGGPDAAVDLDPPHLPE